MTLLHDLIVGSASKRPDGPALLRGDETLTYGKLAAEVSRVASAFAKLGLVRHERVAVFLPKTPETVTAMFAASCAGGIFVPINPVLKSAQVGHILRDSGAKILITSMMRAKSLQQEFGNCNGLKHVITVDEVGPKYSECSEVIGWQELAEFEPGVVRCGIDADPAAILYTSGSTGKPKGVVLSQRNMVSGASSVAQYLENTEADRLLGILPFSFDYGFSQLSTGFLVGASIVLMDHLLPRDIVRAAETYRVSGIAGVPPLWAQLADLDWPGAARENLRYITNSGGAMPTNVLGKLRAQLPNTSVFLMYGLTEAFRSTYLPPQEIDKRPTSIGKAIPNAEIYVVRSDGTECDAGEEGELVHRGVLVGLGYWNDPVRTAERFKPAPGMLPELAMGEMAVWSGDSVVKDEDGFLYFVGRRDEMIKTSGYRVSPTEIEEVIYSSGMVTEAAAVGVPHLQLGHAIVVFVVAAERRPEDQKELLLHCRMELPAYMVPLQIEWRLEALPRNANGKIDRRLLALESAELFVRGTDG